MIFVDGEELTQQAAQLLLTKDAPILRTQPLRISPPEFTYSFAKLPPEKRSKSHSILSWLFFKARPAGARESVPEGHLKVAHYEVVGKALKIAPSRKDERTLSQWLAYGLASASSQSIVPCGTGRF